MKNGPATDHFGFCFEMGLAGLLPPGTDHFGFGFEMGLSGGEGFHHRLPPGMKNGPATDHFGFGFEMGLAGLRIVKRGASRRTASSTAVTIPVDRRFPDERGMETPDGILPESTKKE